MTKTTAPTLTDEETFGLLRNALLVAGVELGGPEGDHWPVVKQTIYELSRDVETRRVRREAHEELCRQIDKLLCDAESKVRKLSKEEQAEALPKLAEIREILEACATPAIIDELVMEEIPMPKHLASAAAILDTWEKEHV